MSKFSQTVRSALRYLLGGIFLCTGFLLRQYFQRLTHRRQRNVPNKQFTHRAGSAQLVSSSRMSPVSSTDSSVPGVLSVPPGTQVTGDTSSVLTRRVALYVLWNRRFLPAEDSFPTDIWHYWEPIGPWYVLHLVWKPDSNTEKERWKNSAETLQAVTALCHCANQVAQSVAASHTTHGETVFPVYSVLHVKEIVQKETFRFRRRAWKVSKKERTLSARRALMQHILRHLEAFVEQEQADWSSATFSHYDQDTGKRGWITIHPRQSFVAGLSDSQLLTLIEILQHRDMVNLSQPRPRISIERHEEVLARIGQWNSTQEMREPVDQLAELVSSGQKSTDGQVLLNLVLAFLGLLVSLASTVSDVQAHLREALALLFIASLCFWGFARSGWAIWQALGLFAIVGTLLLYISLWYRLLLHLFSLLVQGIHY